MGSEQHGDLQNSISAKNGCTKIKLCLKQNVMVLSVGFLDSCNSFSKGKEEGSHIESIVVLLFKSTYSYVTLAQNKKRSIQFI